MLLHFRTEHVCFSVALTMFFALPFQSPPKVPPILELELPQAEIPEDLVDKDEKPR